MHEQGGHAAGSAADVDSQAGLEVHPSSKPAAVFALVSRPFLPRIKRQEGCWNTTSY
jgi:hypothetical protein